MTSRSHQGLVRLNNEDDVYCDEQAQFAVLADGMGGLLAGEVASAIAVETVRTKLLDPGLGAHPEAAMEQLMGQANQAVADKAHALNYVGKMGTTLVVFAQHEEGALYGHCGDSRLYTYLDGKLVQLTRDHTLAQQLCDSGVLSEAEASVSNKRHVLTHAVGLPGVFMAEIGTVPPCERVLLCSDGLSDLVSDAEMAEIMSSSNGEECVNLLLKAALDRGGRDNVTIALLEM